MEDISAPRCFEIEERLKELLDIPVFHDDQHGTAIVVLAGIINALKVTGKQKDSCKVIVNGAGSAGIAITKLLLTYGFSHITMCDINGILSKNSPNLGLLPCREPSLVACGIEEELTVTDTCRRKGTSTLLQTSKTINHPLAIGCQPRTEGCITIPTILEE